MGLSANERAIERGLYLTTQAAQQTLDDLLWATFQVGDELQRDAVDFLFDVFTLRAFTPRYAARVIARVAEQSQETGRVLLPGTGSRLAWQELKNKYEVYNLVKHVETLLGIPRGGAFPLKESIEKAYALGAYPDLWAVEGLGHNYAAAVWKPGGVLRNLLTDDQAGVLPAKSLTMMHAGLGLALAERLLNTITPFSRTSESDAVLAEFATLCRENSRPGYAGACFESLGLVTRTWHPQMMELIDRTLHERAPEVAGYFWHGAGRALYFLPIHFVPGSLSPWLAVDDEAPHELARMNLLAGLTWAVTLVNMRQPEILASLLKTLAPEPARDAALSNGVVSALIMGIDTTPDDIYIAELCRYRPAPADPTFARRWDQLVAQPVIDAMNRYYPALKQRGALEEVFHYQPFANLAA